MATAACHASQRARPAALLRSSIVIYICTSMWCRSKNMLGFPAINGCAYHPPRVVLRQQPMKRQMDDNGAPTGPGSSRRLTLALVSFNHGSAISLNRPSSSRCQHRNSWWNRNGELLRFQGIVGASVGRRRKGIEKSARAIS